MLNKNMVGLDWSTFFIDENGNNISKKQLLEDLKGCDNAEGYYNRIVCHVKFKGFEPYDENSRLALERVLCRFLVQDTNFASDVLTEEEYLKAQELISRKQFNSKLLKQLNGKFSYLLCCVTNNKLGEIFMLDVIREKSIICDEKANKSFAELKSIIDKITAGVKSACYLEAGVKSLEYMVFKLDEKSNDFIKEKYLYDVNGSVGNDSLFLRNFDGKYLNELFKNKLFSNDKFWEKHTDFNMAKFINTVREYNSDAHANRILTYIFEETKKDNFAIKLIENNLSLIYLNEKEYLKNLLVRTFNFSFGRFGIKKIFDDLIYPFSKVEDFEEKLKRGKQIFEKILYDEIYAHEKETVKSFIGNEIANPRPVVKEQKWTLLDMLDSFTFGFHNTEDKRVVELLREDYFTVENILNRVYIKSYYLSTIAKDEKDLSHKFFELFYDLTQAIEKRTGIQTTFQKDKTIREEAFEKLKEYLSKYNIKISDKYKSEYIISLLDRKIACFEEVEKFPILEQLGDAIYGFAVAELLFYNPSYNQYNCDYYNLHQSYISAEKQVEICKKIGIDKLYLKASTIAHKYEYDKLIDADKERFSIQQVMEGYSVKEKYIADSLEMIVGTICKDCGIKQALDFAKTIIIETFPDVFIKEIRDNDKELFFKFFSSSEYDPNRMDTERDYLSKILPALYGEMEIGHGMVNHALVKLMLTLCLETDSVDARNYITNNYSDSVVEDKYAERSDINRILHDYFYNGLEFVIEKYKKEIINNYKNK